MPGIALAFNLLVYLLACVGLMVIFLGGGGYLPVLLVLLTLSLPACLATGMVATWALRRRGIGLGAAWHALPQWLAVAFWLAVALLLCGLLALLVTLQLAETAPRPWQYLPGIAGLVAAVAFLPVAAWQQARGPAR